MYSILSSNYWHYCKKITWNKLLGKIWRNQHCSKKALRFDWTKFRQVVFVYHFEACNNQTLLKYSIPQLVTDKITVIFLRTIIHFAIKVHVTKTRFTHSLLKTWWQLPWWFLCLLKFRIKIFLLKDTKPCAQQVMWVNYLYGIYLG